MCSTPGQVTETFFPSKFLFKSVNTQCNIGFRCKIQGFNIPYVTRCRSQQGHSLIAVTCFTHPLSPASPPVTISLVSIVRSQFLGLSLSSPLPHHVHLFLRFEGQVANTYTLEYYSAINMKPCHSQTIFMRSCLRDTIPPGNARDPGDLKVWNKICCKPLYW